MTSVTLKFLNQGIISFGSCPRMRRRRFSMISLNIFETGQTVPAIKWINI